LLCEKVVCARNHGKPCSENKLVFNHEFKIQALTDKVKVCLLAQFWLSSITVKKLSDL